MQPMMLHVNPPAMVMVIGSGKLLFFSTLSNPYPYAYLPDHVSYSKRNPISRKQCSMMAKQQKDKQDKQRKLPWLARDGSLPKSTIAQ